MGLKDRGRCGRRGRRLLGRLEQVQYAVSSSERDDQVFAQQKSHVDIVGHQIEQFGLVLELVHVRGRGQRLVAGADVAAGVDAWTGELDKQTEVHELNKQLNDVAQIGGQSGLTNAGQVARLDVQGLGESAPKDVIYQVQERIVTLTSGRQVAEVAVFVQILEQVVHSLLLNDGLADEQKLLDELKVVVQVVEEVVHLGNTLEVSAGTSGRVVEQVSEVGGFIFQNVVAQYADHWPLVGQLCKATVSAVLDVERLEQDGQQGVVTVLVEQLERVYLVLFFTASTSIS